MSKDIFEIINPTNTLGVCRPLAHILEACETIVYNALLSKYRYYQKNDMLDDGWFYSTIPDLFESTSFSAFRQKRCITTLESFGLIETKNRGLPARRSFRIINDLELIAKLVAKGEEIMRSAKIEAALSYEKKRKHSDESAEVGSYKMIRNDESEWIKIPDHQTPIISKELFEQAKARIRKFSVNKKPREYVLKGKVYCGCCDHALNRRNDILYACEYGRIAPDRECKDVSIRVEDLERTVFDTIRSQAQCFVDTDADIKARAEKSALELNGYEQKLKLLQESKRELYEQYILGILDIDSVFSVS